MRTLLFLLSLGGCLAAMAKEYVVPAGADVSKFFAELPTDATKVSFSAAAEYRASGAILLPDATLLVIDGAGATLRLTPGQPGFIRKVADQKEAMRKTSSRYAFRDFAEINGGTKAFELRATLGTTIRDCRLTAQSHTALELQFCLMARVENVLVTQPGDKGFVITTGDWPGANWNNSQSNSTVLAQCRVFASKTTTVAFTVLNTTGVRISDCISEGADLDHDLFLSATTDGNEELPARNTVVKTFILENFHVEHRARKGSIYVNMPPRASVLLSAVYWNGPQNAPVLVYTSGQVDLVGIGWWNPDFRIGTRVNAPRINVLRSNNALRFNDGKVVDNKAGALELYEPLPENKVLKTNYARVAQTSM